MKGVNRIDDQEDGVFVGSNTALAAPVTIGKGRHDRRGLDDHTNAPVGELTVARAEADDDILLNQSKKT